MQQVEVVGGWVSEGVARWVLCERSKRVGGQRKSVWCVQRGVEERSSRRKESALKQRERGSSEGRGAGSVGERGEEEREESGAFVWESKRACEALGSGAGEAVERERRAAEEEEARERGEEKGEKGVCVREGGVWR